MLEDDSGDDAVSVVGSNTELPSHDYSSDEDEEYIPPQNELDSGHES